MFYQIFLSPQVKRWAIITYKHGIYELPHELPNNLRLRKSGDIRKVPKLHRMIAQSPVPPAKIKALSPLAKKSRRIAIKPFSWCAHMKTRVSLRYFVIDCLWKPFFDSNSSQTPSKFFYLTILVTLRLLTLL